MSGLLKSFKPENGKIPLSTLQIAIRPGQKGRVSNPKTGKSLFQRYAGYENMAYRYVSNPKTGKSLFQPIDCIHSGHSLIKLFQTRKRENPSFNVKMMNQYIHTKRDVSNPKTGKSLFQLVLPGFDEAAALRKFQTRKRENPSFNPLQVVMRQVFLV